MSKHLLSAAFLWGYFSLGQALAAPLVTNGGFETGDLSGWNVNAGIVTCFTDPTLAHTGNSGAAFLAFISPSELTQDITTVAGHQYLVEFFAESGAVPFDSAFDVTFAGSGLNIASTLTDTYSHYSFIAVASGALTTLSFTTNPNPQGVNPDTYLLDDVSITDLSVPEVDRSSAPIPFAMALALLGLARRGRPRQVA